MVVQTRKMGQATRGHAARLHAQRTQEKLYILTGIDELRAQLAKIAPSNKGEPEVVSTAELRAVIVEWKLCWAKSHPMKIGYWNDAEDRSTQPLGPHAQLSQESGIHERTIGRIVNDEVPYVGARVADALLCAMDRVDAWHTGDVNVMINPTWKPQRWIDYMETALEIRHKTLTIHELMALRTKSA